MNILFLGYWGANDGLSQSTIIPHLQVLAEFEDVGKIIYVSIERASLSDYQIPGHNKIEHRPYYSITSSRLLTKFTDFIRLPFLLRKVISNENIKLLMCRSSIAGGIGYLTHKITKIPFTVESYEPHADYMAELGIWAKHGMSYSLQKYFEKKQKKYAWYLMPVTFHYRDQLLKEGLDSDKVLVIPCTVDVEEFAFDQSKRLEIRSNLGISKEAVVGIYVGKFGDLYQDKEAFRLFQSAFKFYSNFYLLLLNNQPKDFIKRRLREFDIPESKVVHKLVNHYEVPSYLSASDFAFSLHKSSNFSYAFSPIKNGEYWANGLPVIIPEKIGDDSEIIDRENGGVIVKANLEVNWSIISLTRKNQNARLAQKYRSRNLVRKAYELFVVINS